jgi:hypothetical protein
MHQGQKRNSHEQKTARPQEGIEVPEGCDWVGDVLENFCTEKEISLRFLRDVEYVANIIMRCVNPSFMLKTRGASAWDIGVKVVRKIS